MMRRVNFLTAALLLLALSCTAHATPYYQSATMGEAGQTGGDALGDFQFIGVRFVVSAPVTVGRIGGHIGKTEGAGNETLFGALVQLSGLTDMPDSLDLSTPDVLAVTTFIAPSTSDDIAIPIGPVTLGTGTYGVLFGSHLFGATGRGYIPSGQHEHRLALLLLA